MITGSNLKCLLLSITTENCGHLCEVHSSPGCLLIQFKLLWGGELQTNSQLFGTWCHQIARRNPLHKALPVPCAEPEHSCRTFFLPFFLTQTIQAGTPYNQPQSLHIPLCTTGKSTSIHTNREKLKARWPINTPFPKGEIRWSLRVPPLLEILIKCSLRVGSIIFSQAFLLHKERSLGSAQCSCVAWNCVSPSGNRRCHWGSLRAWPLPMVCSQGPQLWHQ